MNYENLYIRLCVYCKKTTPRERLAVRNKDDFRLTKDYIYTENHHILPESLGGTDVEQNMVRLLPEEHLIAHQIRWKAYGDPEDFLAIRFIINGFNGKKERYTELEQFSGKFISVYGWFRQNIAEFRKEHGWQTAAGREQISEYRKGKFPGRCIKTGEILGEFSVDDPRVLSGEIVHHSKGRHSYFNHETLEKIFCKAGERPPGFSVVCADFGGAKNPKYSGITDEEIYRFCENCVIVLKDLGYNEFPSMRKIMEMWEVCDTSGRTFPHLTGGLRSGFRFNGDFKTNVIDKICESHDVSFVQSTKTFRKLNLKEVKDAYYRIFG